VAYFHKRNGKWAFTLDIGRDPVTGKRKQKTRSGFKTKKEAQQIARETESQVDEGKLSLNSMNFKQLYDLWLEQSQSRESTKSQQTYMVNAHVIPYFEGKAIKEIKPLHIQHFIKHLRDDKGLGPTSVFNVKGHVHNMLNYAVKMEIIHSNPAQNVVVKKEKTEKNVWDVHQIRQFLEYVKGHSKYWLAYHVALHCGLRIGEIAALKWEDIEGESLHVQRTVTKTKEKWVVQPPKTNKSDRHIPLSHDSLELFREYRSMFPSDEWIFQGQNGFVTTNALRNDFYRMTERSELPRIKFHELRSSYITMLLDNNVPVHIVSNLVGHTQTSTTLDVYTAALDDSLKQTTDVVNQLLSGTNVVPMKKKDSDIPS